MATRLLLPTLLLAVLKRVFALASAMARLATLVCTAAQELAAYLAAAYFDQPAWLVLHLLLPAKTELGREERTLRTRLVIQVTDVGHLRMAAGFGPLALVATWRRFSAAWKR